MCGYRPEPSSGNRWPLTSVIGGATSGAVALLDDGDGQHILYQLAFPFSQAKGYCRTLVSQRADPLC